MENALFDALGRGRGSRTYKAVNHRLHGKKARNFPSDSFQHETQGFIPIADASRPARRHGAKAQKHGLSNKYVFICTGVQRKGHAHAATVNRVKPDAEEQVLKTGLLVI